MTHTWFLTYNKYCRDPREKPQTLDAYNAFCYIILPFWSPWCSAHHTMVTVYVNADCVLCQRCWHTPPQEGICHLSIYLSSTEQSSAGRIMRSHNYKVVFFPCSKADLTPLQPSLSCSAQTEDASWGWQVSENKYDDRQTIMFFQLEPIKWNVIRPLLGFTRRKLSCLLYLQK